MTESRGFVPVGTATFATNILMRIGAIARVGSMAIIRQANRHPRGYVTPKRRDRKALAIYAKVDLYDWVRRVAARENTTIQETVERLLYGCMQQEQIAKLTGPISSEDLRFVDRQAEKIETIEAA